MDNMSTAIIAEKTPICIVPDGRESYNMNYRIVDKLFSSDVDDLYLSITNYIEDEGNNINEIVIDLSGLDFILFKPSRFFTACNLVFNKLSSLSIGITFKVIIGSYHSDMFENIEEEFNFPIVVKESISPPTNIDESDSVIKWRKLAYWFAQLSIIICIFGQCCPVNRLKKVRKLLESVRMG